MPETFGIKNILSFSLLGGGGVRLCGLTPLVNQTSSVNLYRIGFLTQLAQCDFLVQSLNG